MRNRDEIIRQLYNTYKFIEEDISKFREIPCLSDVKDFKDGVKKLSKCVLQEVLDHGFVDTFTKIEKTVEIGTAFNVLYIMSAETGYVIKGADVIALANVEDYKECFDTFIKQNFIRDVDNLNKREIVNELLKRVLAVRLNSDEIKKYRKEESDKQRVLNRKSIYKSIPFSREEIDEVISTLSDAEQNIIDKKENGEKLSHEENVKIYRIKNKITDILKQQKKKKEKSTVSNEVVEKKQPQEEPVVEDNTKEQKPSQEEPKVETNTKEQKPVFSNVIETIQSKNKLENIITKETKERRADENMANENKYYGVIYKRINADHSLIDKAISELPEKEQKLIERKGRISLGIFDKLLTQQEEEKFNSIVNKIESMINPKKKKKSSEPKKRGRRPLSIYTLVPVSKRLLKQYLTQELTDEDLKIVNAREKLIQENKFDEIPTTYKPVINRIVARAKRLLVYKEVKKTSKMKLIDFIGKTIDVPASKEEIKKVIGKLSPEEISLIKKKEKSGKLTSEEYLQRKVVIKKIEAELRKQSSSPSRKKGGSLRKGLHEFLPSLSEEELNKLLEKLSDDDREIIKARSEGKELNQPDLLRYYRVIHKLENGIIPTPRKKRNREKLIVIETQEGKGTHPERSIYTLIPIDRDKLDKYIEEHLNEDEKNIIRTRERIINENSNERTTQRAVDKFARIVQRLRKELISEEEMEEIYKDVRKGIRVSIYDELPFSKEEIDEEISHLSDAEKELIERRENGGRLSKDERYKSKNLTNKIERKINKKKRKAAKAQTPISRGKLVEELKQPKVEEPQKTSPLLAGFDELVENEIQSMGETPEANIKEEIVSKEEVQLPLVNQETKDFADYYRSLLSIAIKDPAITHTVKMRDIAITCVRYGIGECNPSTDSETIAQFFGVSSEYVEQISSTVLKMLYDVIVKSIENTESPKIFQK